MLHQGLISTVYKNTGLYTISNNYREILDKWGSQPFFKQFERKNSNTKCFLSFLYFIIFQYLRGPMTLYPQKLFQLQELLQAIPFFSLVRTVYGFCKHCEKILYLLEKPRNCLQDYFHIDNKILLIKRILILLVNKLNPHCWPL